MSKAVDKRLERSDAIMKKVQKILAHVRNNENAAEAANATALVQKLMLEYNISEQEIAEFEGRPAPSPVEPEYVIYSSKKGRIMWQFSLFGEVARCYFCKFLSFTGTPQGVLIGEKINRDVAKEVFFYLRNEIERLHRIAFMEHKAEMINPQHGRAFYNQFCHGATDIVNERLKLEFRKQQADNNKSTALIVLKDKLVEEAVKQLYPTTKTIRTGLQHRDDGYYSGVRAGHSIPLTPGAKQLVA